MNTHPCSECKWDTVNPPTPTGQFLCCSCQITIFGEVRYAPKAKDKKPVSAGSEDPW